jgi:acyl carrier protein
MLIKSQEVAMNSHPSTQATAVDSLKSWLICWLAAELGVDPEAIEPSQSFLSYGIDSVQAMSLVGDLEVKLHRRLPPTLSWDYPDINTLAHHLAGLVPEEVAGIQSSMGTRAEVENLLAKIDKISDEDVEVLLAQYRAT